MILFAFYLGWQFQVSPGFFKIWKKNEFQNHRQIFNTVHNEIKSVEYGIYG